MKKLMIALAAVAMAAGVQAATANQWTWKVSSSDFIVNPETTTGASGSAYIYCDLTDLQLKSIVDDFASGTFVPTEKTDLQWGYEMNSALASGVFSPTSSLKMESDKRTEGQSYAWTVIVQSKIDGDDYLFIDTASANRLADGKNQTVTYKEFNVSKAAAKDAAAGYAGAGWYTAVPEPTSGLLLLLGVAGLALRRRRA